MNEQPDGFGLLHNPIHKELRQARAEKAVKAKSKQATSEADQITITRIQWCLPGCTPEMALDFARSQKVSLTTVRIWAEQGALKIVQNETCTVCEILKTEPPSMSPSEAARLLMEALGGGCDRGQ